MHNFLKNSKKKSTFYEANVLVLNFKKKKLKNKKNKGGTFYEANVLVLTSKKNIIKN